MITKRILDFDYQLNRIFGKFISNEFYDKLDNAHGIYDIIFCHREGLQDNFKNVINFANYNTKFVIDITTESGNIQCFLEEFVLKTQEYSNQFYLIVDSDITNFEKNVKLNSNVKILQGFDLVFYSFLNETSDNLMSVSNDFFSYENGFISLNNSARNHRLLLILELLRRNIDMSGVSYLCSTASPNGDGYMFDKKTYDSQINNFKEMGLMSLDDYDRYKKLNVPKILDVDSHIPYYLSNSINSYYSKIINLVTENTMGFDIDDNDWGIVTFTEKCIKPYLAKQIPIFIGLYGLQDTIKNLGFDMFDDIIDYSFKNEKNPIKRISLQVDELEKLLKMDLVDYKNKNKKRFDHNYNLLKILTKSGEEKVKSFLYDEILK